MSAKNLSFFQQIWKRFRKNRLELFSLYLVFLLILLAVFADFLAADKPIYAQYNGKTYFPIFYDYLSGLGLYTWEKELVFVDHWKNLDLESSFWPPVRYAEGHLDLINSQYKSPFGVQEVNGWKFRHFLGTDDLGRDVLAGLIHGTRISLSVGIVSVGIAALIGIFLGACAGYFGDKKLQIRLSDFIFLIIGLFLGFFYAFFLRSGSLGEAFSAGFLKLSFHLALSLLLYFAIIVITNLISRPLRYFTFFNRKINLWIDIGISRLIEVVVCLPTLLLIITIASIATPSIFLVMVVIGATTWTTIARLTRAEMLKIRHLEYIQAAQSLGYSEFRIILRHALPNALAPVFVAIAFGIASSILIESSLSFLGIGVPTETVTWGSLLKSARGAPEAWWLAIFPGFAIFVTVTIFNLLGEGIRDALDPRLKN